MAWDPWYPSPVITFVTQPRRSLQIVRIYEISPLILQLSPNPISRANWPARLVPVSKHDSLGMRCLDLRPQQCQLGIVQRCSRYGAEVGFEVCRGNWRDEGSYVGEGTVERGYGSLVEVVAGCDRLDLGEGCIACADDGHSFGRELRSAVHCRKPSARLSDIIC